MKKYILSALLFVAAAISCAAVTRAQAIIDEINDPSSSRVLVAVHRGDWRNNPENSLPAIEDAIRMGADIVEIDIALTADSVLVVCHDRNVDRTATGSGLISDLTLAQIKSLRLYCAHRGQATELQMPTLREALELCKDRIVVNIDKGYQYYDLVQRLSEELGMTGQLLIKGGIAADDVKGKFASYDTNMMFMPIIHPDQENGRVLLDQYTAQGNIPPAVEVCWGAESQEVDDAMKRIADAGSRVWANTLWNSLCGGLSDDRAYYGDPADIYGRILSKGVSIIQTDRPALLLGYLREIGRHD